MWRFAVSCFSQFLVFEVYSLTQAISVYVLNILFTRYSISVSCFIYLPTYVDTQHTLISTNAKLCPIPSLCKALGTKTRVRGNAMKWTWLFAKVSHTSHTATLTWELLLYKPHLKRNKEWKEFYKRMFLMV